MKRLLFILFLMNWSAHALEFTQFSKNEFNKFSSQKSNAIYNEYIKFFIRIEQESLYEKTLKTKKVTRTKYRLLEEFLISDAVANSLTGETCFFGGHESRVVGGYCTHPKNLLGNKSYKSCSNGRFRCNEVLFQANTCIETTSPYENLTDKCRENGKKDPEQIIESLGKDGFQRMQKQVSRFCKENPFYDACDSLKKALKLIDETPEQPPELESTVEQVIDTFKKVPEVSIDKGCFQIEETTVCPKALTESLDDSYSNGFVGFINSIHDGSFKDPRTICSGAASVIQSSDIEKLKEQLDNNHPNNFQLHDFAQACLNNSQEWIEGGRRNEDKKVAQAYLLADFNAKNKRIESGTKDLLESKNQIDSMLGGTVANCEQFKIKSVKEKCEALNSCKTNSGSTQLLDVKAEEVQMALMALNDLKRAKRKLANPRGYLPASKREEAQRIKTSMNQILESNPLLKGEHFKKIINKRDVNFDEIKTTLTKQLHTSRKDINNKINDFIRARECIIGQSNNCSDLDKIINRTKYKGVNTAYPNSLELNSANNYYSCVENMKDNRNDADEVLVDAGVSIALSFTPFVALNAIKLAAATANIASKASQAVKVGALGLDATYGVYQTQKVYNACKESQTQLKAFDGKEALTCHDLDVRMIAGSNVQKCTGQVLLSAALMTPIAAQGLKLAKMPGTKPRQSTTLAKNKAIEGDFIPSSSQVSTVNKVPKSHRIESIIEGSSKEVPEINKNLSNLVRGRQITKKTQSSNQEFIPASTELATVTTIPKSHRVESIIEGTSVDITDVKAAKLKVSGPPLLLSESKRLNPPVDKDSTIPIMLRRIENKAPKTKARKPAKQDQTIKSLDTKIVTHKDVEKFLKDNDHIPALSFNKMLEHGMHWNQSGLKFMSNYAIEHPKFINSLNGSYLFHGARSDSLLGLLKNEGLVPSGQLMKKGQVPYSGELSIGISRNGVNNDHLSTVHLYDIDTAAEYADYISRVKKSRIPWLEKRRLKKSLTKAQKELDTALSNQDTPKSVLDHAKKTHSIAKQRVAQYEQLPKQQQKLILQDFPVVYGLAPKASKVKPAKRNPSSWKEVGVKDGVTPEEIGAVYVPKEKIKYVQELLESSGHKNISVHSIEILR